MRYFGEMATESSYCSVRGVYSWVQTLLSLVSSDLWTHNNLQFLFYKFHRKNSAACLAFLCMVTFAILLER